MRYVVNRGQLSPGIRHSLEASVVDLVGSNLPLLEAITSKPEFVAANPEVVQGLVDRSRTLAASHETASRVAEIAAKARIIPAIPKTDAVNPGYLTASQSRALNTLEAMAQLNAQAPVLAGVKLRLNPLIVGPSGTGKSHLVRVLGARIGAKTLRICVGDWIPLGGRGDVPATLRIQKALEENPRLVLHLDELDKLRSLAETWSLSQLTEVFGILDRSPLGTWSDEQRELLKSAFIVGSGTWQDTWSQRTNPLGFHGHQDDPEDPNRRIRKASVVPEELVNRFNDKWVVLRPYAEADFRKIASALNLEPGVLDPAAAAQGGQNFRAVECALAEHALRRIEAKIEAREALRAGAKGSRFLKTAPPLL